MSREPSASVSISEVQHSLEQATIARGKNRGEARYWLERALACGVMRTSHRAEFELISHNVR